MNTNSSNNNNSFHGKAMGNLSFQSDNLTNLTPAMGGLTFDVEATAAQANFGAHIEQIKKNVNECELLEAQEQLVIFKSQPKIKMIQEKKKIFLKRLAFLAQSHQQHPAQLPPMINVPNANDDAMSHHPTPSCRHEQHRADDDAMSYGLTPSCCQEQYTTPFNAMSRSTSKTDKAEFSSGFLQEIAKKVFTRVAPNGENTAKNACSMLRDLTKDQMSMVLNLLMEGGFQRHSATSSEFIEFTRYQILQDSNGKTIRPNKANLRRFLKTILKL